MSRPRVALLAYDGMEAFELGCAIELFGVVRPGLEDIWYDLAICAEHKGPLNTDASLKLLVPHGLEAIARAQTVIIPNWPLNGEVKPRLAEAIRQAKTNGARIASICSGAFLLAELGLLDNMRATTHWLFAEELGRRFPKIRVEPDVLYIDEGQVVTSAGAAAGIDMMLHLVRKDFGPQVCNLVARRMVVSPHREGGQAQFIPRPVQKRPETRFSKVIEWMRGHAAEQQSVDELARQSAMSSRTFFRRFRQTFGMTPYEWLIQERVSIAKDLLEEGKLSVDQIAGACGFGTAAMLRHHFNRSVGLNPSAYRARFGEPRPGKAAIN